MSRVGRELDQRPRIECNKADAIAVADRRLRERSSGVAGPVERCATERSHAHARTDIHHDEVGSHDLVLEVAHHQLAALCGRLPRDELERVTVRMLA